MDDLLPIIAIAAGVPVVPGTPGPIKSVAEAEAFVKGMCRSSLVLISYQLCDKGWGKKIEKLIMG